MKTIITAAFVLIIYSCSFAQSTKDVVYLKNGSIIKGILTEQNPPADLKIKTADGNIFTYKYEEIEKITKENVAEPQSNLNTASPDNTFIINKSFKRTTYNGKEIRKMKYSEIKTVLLSTNDPEINKNLSTLSTKRTLSTVFVCSGIGLVGLGLIQNSSSQVSNGGWGNSKVEEHSGIGIMLVGLGVELVGAIIGAGSNNLLKRSMMRYNDLAKSKISFYPDLIPVHGNTGFGITLAKKF